MKRIAAGILFCVWLLPCTAQVDTARQFRLAKQIVAQTDTSVAAGTLKDILYTLPASFMNVNTPFPGGNNERLFMAVVHDERNTYNAYVNANGLFKPDPGDSILRYVCFKAGKISWAMVLDTNRVVRELLVFTGGDTSIVTTYGPTGTPSFIQVSCGRQPLFSRTWYAGGEPCAFYYKGEKPGDDIRYSLHRNGKLQSKNYRRGNKGYSVYWSDTGVEQVKNVRKRRGKLSVNKVRHHDAEGKWTERRTTRLRGLPSSDKKVRTVETKLRLYEKGKFRPYIHWDYKSRSPSPY